MHNEVGRKDFLKWTHFLSVQAPVRIAQRYWPPRNNSCLTKTTRVSSKRPQLGTTLALEAGPRKSRHFSNHEAGTSQETDDKENGHGKFLRTRDMVHRKAVEGLKRESGGIGQENGESAEN
jgi:hypothetical protein